MAYKNIEVDFANFREEIFSSKAVKYTNVENKEESSELDFTFASENEKVKEEITRKSFTFAEDAWRKLKQNKLSIVGLILLY